MKIKSKLIGIGVASLGAILSIGGAFALYQQDASNVQFGISAGTYAGSGGSVTYKINNNTGNSNVAPSYLKTNGENGGTGLSATYTQVHYAFALGAQYTNGNAQDYAVGNLAVSLTNIPEAYRGKLSIWVGVSNYVENSIGAVTYGQVFMNSDYAITDENTQFVANHDVAVSSAGTQVLDIYLKYDLNGVDTLAMNEASLGYSLSVVWGAPSNAFVPAYIKGDANQWTVDDGYAMLPNINKANSEGWEWIYNNLPGTIGETKCFMTENEVDKWSAENFLAEAEKSYNVTWSGVNGAAANYQEII